MDPLTLALIAQTILQTGGALMGHRQQSRAQKKQERADALTNVIQGLSPQRGLGAPQGVAAPQPMGLGNLADPLIELLKRRPASPPAPVLTGQPGRDRGAVAAQNISRLLGRAR